MSQQTLTGSDTSGSAARAAPASEVPELPAVAVGELDSVVGVLTAKFPGCSRAHMREVVYETHRRLAAAARVPAHLIPLTFNFSRSELEMCATRQVSTRP